LFEALLIIVSSVFALERVPWGRTQILVEQAVQGTILGSLLLVFALLLLLVGEVLRSKLNKRRLRLLTIAVALLWPIGFLAEGNVDSGVPALSEILYLSLFPAYGALVRLPTTLGGDAIGHSYPG
jgi:hypothetical protein